MPSIYSSSSELVVYYGRDELERLAGQRRVVLQAGYHLESELAELKAAGTETLAYLALSEDTGPPAPWQRAESNPDWGGRYVDLTHPGWLELVNERTSAALDLGFSGLFLDTLDLPAKFSDEEEPLLELVTAVRSAVGSGYLLANRGYALHEQLAPLVNGFLFEAFSTTWQGGYRALTGVDLMGNAARVNALRASGRDLFALDYADTPALAAFARSRAATHGLPLQVADRNLTRLA